MKFITVTHMLLTIAAFRPCQAQQLRNNHKPINTAGEFSSHPNTGGNGGNRGGESSTTQVRDEISRSAGSSASHPNAGGNGGKNRGGESTTIQARGKISFDEHPEETFWQLYEGCAECDHHKLIMAGPDNIPAPFQTLQTTLELHPGKEYTFMLEDTNGDGFDGKFSIYLIGDNGQETLLALGPDAPFEHFSKTSFTVPEAYALARSLCTDGTSSFPLEVGVNGNCASLSSSPELTYLCGYVDVALGCPRTCAVCEDQKTLKEQGCGSDLPGVVKMDDMVGERTCEWLKLSMDAGRFASLCEYTSVAFHCPTSCGVCDMLK